MAAPSQEIHGQTRVCWCLLCLWEISIIGPGAGLHVMLAGALKARVQFHGCQKQPNWIMNCEGP
jgi:hypothetical protein